MRGSSHKGSVCVMRWCDTYKGIELFTLGVNPLKRGNNRVSGFLHREITYPDTRIRSSKGQKNARILHIFSAQER